MLKSSGKIEKKKIELQIIVRIVQSVTLININNIQNIIIKRAKSLSHQHWIFVFAKLHA